MDMETEKERPGERKRDIESRWTREGKRESTREIGF